MAKVHVFLQNGDTTTQISGLAASSEVHFYGTAGSETINIPDPLSLTGTTFFVEDLQGTDVVMIPKALATYNSNTETTTPGPLIPAATANDATGNILILTSTGSSGEVLKLKGVGASDSVTFSDQSIPVTSVNATGKFVFGTAVPAPTIYLNDNTEKFDSTPATFGVTTGLTASVANDALATNKYLSATEYSGTTLNLHTTLASGTYKATIKDWQTGSTATSAVLTASSNLIDIASDTSITGVDGSANATLADGKYTVYVTDTSTGLKSSAITFNIDKTAPATPIMAKIAGDVTTGNVYLNAAEKAAGITITGNAEAGASVIAYFGANIEDNAGTKIVATAGADGTYTVTIPAASTQLTAVADASSTTMKVEAYDAAGNKTSSATKAMVADLTLPILDATNPILVTTNDGIKYTFKVLFSEALDTTKALATSDFAWAVTGGGSPTPTLNTVAFDPSDATHKTVILTGSLSAAPTATFATFTLAYTAAGTPALTDVAGNAVASITATSPTKITHTLSSDGGSASLQTASTDVYAGVTGVADDFIVNINHTASTGTTPNIQYTFDEVNAKFKIFGFDLGTAVGSGGDTLTLDDANATPIVSTELDANISVADDTANSTLSLVGTNNPNLSITLMGVDSDYTGLLSGITGTATHVLIA